MLFLLNDSYIFSVWGSAPGELPVQACMYVKHTVHAIFNVLSIVSPSDVVHIKLQVNIVPDIGFCNEADHVLKTCNHTNISSNKTFSSI